jgi:hypothetical protein
MSPADLGSIGVLGSLSRSCISLSAMAALMPFPVFGCSELTIVVVWWGVWHGVKRRTIHGVQVERQGGACRRRQ